MSENDNDEHAAAHQSGPDAEAVRPGGEPPRPDSALSNNKSEPPSWIEKWTFIILVLTFGSALLAGVEAWRLADLTQDAIKDVRDNAADSHADTIRAENLTADAIGQAQANANIAHIDNIAALGRGDEANTISRHSAEASQRAWVYPGETAVDGEITVGQPFKAVIQYTNSGREPALSFIPVLKYTVFPKAVWKSGKAAEALEQWRRECFKTVCNPKQLKGATTRAVYPTTGNNTYNLNFSTAADDTAPKFNVREDTKSGAEIFTLQGCFLYKSGRVIHHTAFCAFYEAPPIKAPNLNICTVANNAD